MRLAEVEAGMQPQPISGELPRRASGPLVAMTPTRVEDFEPSRSAVREHIPSPAVAELLEHKIHASTLDEERHDIVRKVGRDQAGVEFLGVVVPRGRRIVGKAVIPMASQKIKALLLLRY